MKATADNLNVHLDLEQLHADVLSGKKDTSDVIFEAFILGAQLSFSRMLILLYKSVHLAYLAGRLRGFCDWNRQASSSGYVMISKAGGLQ